MDGEVVERIQAALRDASLDGWLLFEFHGHNPVASSILGLGHTTRRSFSLIPADSDPVALVHRIETSAWREWPWETRLYAGWREMEEGLADLLSSCRTVAMEISPRSSVPTLDLVPSGIVELVGECGVRMVSSGDLVSRFHARWTPEQLEEHRRTAEILARVAREAFQRAADAVQAGEPTSEGALSRWILDTLEARGVGVDADCIVAVGPRAADPHYAPEESGEIIGADTLLLIDLWGRPDDRGVAADQTWMGYLGSELPDEVEEVWAAVRDARDAVVGFLQERHRKGSEVRGFEADDVARELIRARGFGDYFVHRTGHSIDVELHGSGPNLDNLETRDDRILVPGVGFSVEPGVYIPDRVGVRSEINVHWGEDGPEVTPSRPQREIFLLFDE
ncbi:MAG: M24 family metallopeptidase [Longimicrobiales bacterium]|nr:M24 family metallopeptidase [Longimicrobiales bacterium]